MNELKILENMIIGSSEAVAQLAQKDLAKILVVSDTHGDSDAFEDIILSYGPDCDALIFCGDGICDVQTYLVNAATEKKLKDALPPVLGFVRGNGDPPKMVVERDKQGLATKIVEVRPSLSLTVARFTILAIHGHQLTVDFGLESLSYWARAKKARAVFFGHTHVPEMQEFDGCFFLNPGSPSRPRSSAGRTIAIISVNKKTGSIKERFFSVG